jgi:hypothetical protein
VKRVSLPAVMANNPKKVINKDLGEELADVVL